MGYSEPWLDAPSDGDDPPPYSIQAQPQQTKAPAVSSTRAYVLTPTSLPIPAQPRLALTAITYHGLSVYGPVAQSAPQNSPNVPSMASLSISSPPASSQQPRKPQVIFHMMNHAETLSWAENDFFSTQNSSNDFSALGKQQILNFKANFPYMKQVQFVLCSLSTRAANTALQIFGEQLKTVAPTRKVMPLTDFRDCPAKYPASDLVKMPPFQASCKSAYASDKSNFNFLPHWNPFNDLVLCRELQILSMPERADHVRLDLYHFAKVIVDGGKWKGADFDRYMGTRDIHVVVVSHSNFLTRLTHREHLLDSLPIKDVGFANVQYRTYKFAPASAVESGSCERYALYETNESKSKKHVKDSAAASK